MTVATYTTRREAGEVLVGLNLPFFYDANVAPVPTDGVNGLAFGIKWTMTNNRESWLIESEEGMTWTPVQKTVQS